MTFQPFSSARWLMGAAAVGIALAGAGCGPIVSPASIPPVAANTARVWFYQDGSPNDGVGVAAIRLNGNIVGLSQSNSGFYRDVPPGPYHVSLDNPVPDINQSADIAVGPGQVAYIKIATLDNWAVSSGSVRSGGGKTTFYVWPMPAIEGSAAIAHLPSVNG